MNYNKIIDPLNNTSVNIHSKRGMEILKKYTLVGGSNKKQVKNYFIENHNLNTKKQKFCRCALHVMTNNSEECNRNKLWKNPRKYSKCYNPYTVCAASTRTTTGGKPCYYNFLSMDIPNEEVISYSHIKSKEYNKWALKTGNKRLQEIENTGELRMHLQKWYSIKYKLIEKN